MKNDFIILRDTRQQKENHIIKEFDTQNVLHIQTKLESADYMALRHDEKGFYTDYSVLIDTKKDLLELCNNLAHTSEHQRVVREVELGHKLGCTDFVFLIGENNIKTINDIKSWSNKHTKVKGETLYKIMNTFKEHHNCRFIIISKKKMGEMIIKLLGEESEKEN